LTLVQQWDRSQKCGTVPPESVELATMRYSRRKIVLWGEPEKLISVECIIVRALFPASCWLVAGHLLKFGISLTVSVRAHSLLMPY
jgi:hypothetical protein